MYKSPHIPLLPYLRIAWKYRKALLKAAGIGLLIGLFIALSIPKEYEAAVATAAESTAIPDDDDWGGLSLDGTLGGSKRYDALRPSLYPEIFSSPSFLITLFDLPVQTVDCPPDSTLTLRDYLDKHQRRPWWTVLAAAVGKLAHWVTSPFREEERDYAEDFATDTLRGEQPTVVALSAKDAGLAAAIGRRITIVPDKKRRVTTFICRMQDPLVAATVADSLSQRIKDYITAYRTRKAREEWIAAQKLCQQALERYHRAQEAEAAFEDRNRDLASKNAQKEQVRLRILTEQAYQEYTRATLQVHAAQVKVIRVRPVFAVIQPATTPVAPASPGKMKYMAVFALVGVGVGCARLWWRGRVLHIRL